MLKQFDKLDGVPRDVKQSDNEGVSIMPSRQPSRERERELFT
jgi:hypothetical protein